MHQRGCWTSAVQERARIASHGPWPATAARNRDTGNVVLRRRAASRRRPGDAPVVPPTEGCLPMRAVKRPPVGKLIMHPVAQRLVNRPSRGQGSARTGRRGRRTHAQALAGQSRCPLSCGTGRRACPRLPVESVTQPRALGWHPTKCAAQRCFAGPACTCSRSRARSRRGYQSCLCRNQPCRAQRRCRPGDRPGQRRVAAYQATLPASPPHRLRMPFATHCCAAICTHEALRTLPPRCGPTWPSHLGCDRDHGRCSVCHARAPRSPIGEFADIGVHFFWLRAERRPRSMYGGLLKLQGQPMEPSLGRAGATMPGRSDRTGGGSISPPRRRHRRRASFA